MKLTNCAKERLPIYYINLHSSIYTSRSMIRNGSTTMTTILGVSLVVEGKDEVIELVRPDERTLHLSRYNMS